MEVSKKTNHGTLGRRSHKKKKRPQSAFVLTNENHHHQQYRAVSSLSMSSLTHPRYHETSFPLFSGTLLPCKQEQPTPVQAGGVDRISFAFEDLPDICKLKVFSFLTNLEKARYSCVSQEWNLILQTACLWRHVLFSSLPIGCLPSVIHPAKIQCYDCYKQRVQQFTAHLVHIRPRIHTLKFSLDIAEVFLELIDRVLHFSTCSDIRHASINWKDTLAIPLWCDEISVDINFIYHHRRRQRLFVGFFDEFTTIAPNIQSLILPFDWSCNTVEYMTRLHELHSLVLEKYFVFQQLDQALLTQLLSGLPKLRRLLLEVWTPSGQGFVTFSLASNSMEYLDISQTRGFYVQEVDMPQLRHFRLVKHPLNGPWVLDRSIKLPCIYTTLVRGCPRLQTINEHRLSKDWRHCLDTELEAILMCICACRKHKGWALN